MSFVSGEPLPFISKAAFFFTEKGLVSKVSSWPSLRSIFAWGFFFFFFFLLLFQVLFGVKIKSHSFCLILVPGRGFEPPRLAALPPQGSVYASFTTRAFLAF